MAEDEGDLCGSDGEGVSCEGGEGIAGAQDQEGHSGCKVDVGEEEGEDRRWDVPVDRWRWPSCPMVGGGGGGEERDAEPVGDEAEGGKEAEDPECSAELAGIAVSGGGSHAGSLHKDSLSLLRGVGVR